MCEVDAIDPYEERARSSPPGPFRRVGNSSFEVVVTRDPAGESCDRGRVLSGKSHGQ